MINNNILLNAPFISAAISCLIAQLIKPITSLIIGEELDIKKLFSTGGMPSSHTASVVGLTTSIGSIYGIGSHLFAICAVFSLIVIHDAMGIRQEAGKQAALLNQWSQIFSEDGRFTEANLKTMLGHTFSQVFFGFLLGIIVGFVVTYTI